MPDPIFAIGESGLNVSEEKIRNLMLKMVNAETPGFKGSDIVVRSFPVELEAAEKRLNTMAPKIEGTYYNHQKGSLISTGRPTDIALGGNGFFIILGPWGEGYTRDGRFKLDSEGHLITVTNGYPLLGQNGPLEVPAGSELEITQDGDVKANGLLLDRIRVGMIEKRELGNLQSLNGVIFKPTSDFINIQDVATPRVVQGYVEASNVNIIEETRDLIVNQRYATGNTEVIKARETSLSRLMSIGRTNQ